MLRKKPIEEVLQKLHIAYDNNTTNSDITVYLSKLALLELCGWMESCFDDIFEKFCDAKITCKHCREGLKKTLKDVHGFSYDDHIKRFIKAIPDFDIIKFEEQIDSEIVKIKSITSNLWGVRIKAAHTAIHTSGLQRGNYRSPSAIKKDLDELYPCLVKLEKHLLSFYKYSTA